MSSHGLSKDDKRILNMIADARRKHKSTHTNETPPEPPNTLLEARGRHERKVHKPDPDSSSSRPWCLGKGGISSEGLEWRERSLAMARVWREPCKVCFPGGFPDE